MASSEGYMIIDIGTGNVRVAVTTLNGDIVSVQTATVQYVKDDLYPDALYFDPPKLWDQILALGRKACAESAGIAVKAITVSSQREGIVLLDDNGKGIMGLSNHDHRGREWEDTIQQKSRIYSLTGRYPSSLFSALKVIGVRHRRPEVYQQLRTIVSISDWAQFRLSGVAGYEHSQASETQLYDVARKSWSSELCALFDLPERLLPPLHHSGTVLGRVLPEVSTRLQVPPDTVVVVGGADTQLAIKSTQPAVNDVVIVSGTTTPIVKIVPEYITDKKERTWTNRHIDKDSFILEANAGVTGLNYQRLKEIFYPNEGYDVIEEELEAVPKSLCTASLGSLIADEDRPLTRGGFVFDVPVSHELTRAAFVSATIWDIACCIKENYECLQDVVRHDSDYVWACSGGLQSPMLRQCIADFIGKKIQVRDGFQQASVKGGALICNEALDTGLRAEAPIQTIHPREQSHYAERYQQWKNVRAAFKKNF